MSKSDCCGAEMDTLCEHNIVFGYRCQKCKRDTVPRAETPLPKLTSDCCGAEVQEYRNHDNDEHTNVWICRHCANYCKLGVPKLTPTQVKAIRWPNKDEIEKKLYEVEGSECWNLPVCIEMVHWSIRYALQDLMPEEEEK